MVVATAWSPLIKSSPPFSCHQIVEQKEWHRLLAEADLSQAPVPEPMTFRYWSWHGHPVRYAEGPQPSDPQAPTLVLVHGFGASCDQWSKIFDRLVPLGYKIFAMVRGGGRLDQMRKQRKDILPLPPPPSCTPHKPVPPVRLPYLQQA